MKRCQKSPFLKKMAFSSAQTLACILGTFNWARALNFFLFCRSFYVQSCKKYIKAPRVGNGAWKTVKDHVFRKKNGFSVGSILAWILGTFDKAKLTSFFFKLIYFSLPFDWCKNQGACFFGSEDIVGFFELLIVFSWR